MCNKNQTVSDICLKTFISSILNLGKRVGSMFNLKTHNMLTFFFFELSYVTLNLMQLKKKFDKGLIQVQSNYQCWKAEIH